MFATTREIDAIGFVESFLSVEEILDASRDSTASLARLSHLRQRLPRAYTRLIARIS